MPKITWMGGDNSTMMRGYGRATVTLRPLLAVCLLVAALSGTAIAGPFEDAYAANARGDYATALRLYRALERIPIRLQHILRV